MKFHKGNLAQCMKNPVIQKIQLTPSIKFTDWFHFFARIAATFFTLAGFQELWLHPTQ